MDDKILPKGQKGARSSLRNHLFNFWDPLMVPGTLYILVFRLTMTSTIQSYKYYPINMTY